VTQIRKIIANLKSSFEVGGVEAMSQTHSAATKASWSYRLLCWVVNLVYPATALLDIAKDLDRHIGEMGVTGGSKAMLSKLSIQSRSEHPTQGKDEITTCPIVIFGRHGSILTPFLIAASLDRPDLKMLSATYIAKLGPNVARSMYPVVMPQPTFHSAGRKGLVPRISGWLTARLERAVDKSDAKEQNRASLIQSAKHVRDGGALLVAPDACDPKVKWRHGIGHLIVQIAKISEPEGNTYLVPYRIWAPITGVFHLLSRNPILRALGKRQYRMPIRVAFEKPILLSSVIEQTGLDPAAITEYLEAHYRGLGF
jgi:hypothetical protein